MPKLNNGIVAHTFLNIYETITSFCQVLKETHTKENWFLFSASRRICRRMQTVIEKADKLLSKASWAVVS